MDRATISRRIVRETPIMYCWPMIQERCRQDTCSTWRRSSRNVARAFGFPAYPALSFFSHRGSEGDSDQQSFRSDETADSLTPRLLFVLYEHSMPLRFKFFSRLFDIVNIKLKPSLWRRNFLRPGILTEA